MSRNLDALFAERVLGFIVVKRLVVTPGAWSRHPASPNDGWYMRHPPDRGHILAEGGDGLVPPYTTSLDAALAGVKKVFIDHFNLDWMRCLGKWCASTHCLDCHTDRCLSECVDFVWVERPTPAAAVVVACLLAAGVPEREIEDAELDEPDRT